MPNPYNGSRQGKRGGSIYRASRTAERTLDLRPAALRKAKPLHLADSARSTWDMTESAGLHYQCNEEIEETHETHGPIIRKDLGHQLHLAARPQTLEFEPRRERRIVRKWNGRKACYEPVFNADGSPCYVKGMPDAEGWIENSRLTWKSDRTLLRQGKPDPVPAGFYRQDGTRTTFEREEPATVEIPVIDRATLDRLNLDHD